MLGSSSKKSGKGGIFGPRAGVRALCIIPATAHLSVISQNIDVRTGGEES